MAAQTGRTLSKWTTLIIGDSGNATLREIPINTLSALGLVYDEQELTAWQDAIKGSLPAMPDAPIEIGGPWDTSAAAAVGTLSGSQTILSAINGALTPLTLDIHFGMRHAWESGEPQFGITGTTANGYLCTRFTVNSPDMTYAARFVLFPGSAAPAFGTTAETT